MLYSPFPDISDQGCVSPSEMCISHLKLLRLNAAVIRWIYDLGYARRFICIQCYTDDLMAPSSHNSVERILCGNKKCVSKCLLWLSFVNRHGTVRIKLIKTLLFFAFCFCLIHKVLTLTTLNIRSFFLSFGMSPITSSLSKIIWISVHCLGTI